MSTAYIARERRAGEYEFVHSIKNSHPEYLGILLKKYYNDLNKVKDMLEAGDIKKIHKDIKNIERLRVTGNYTSRIVPDYQLWNMFYIHKIDYLYIYRDGKWNVISGSTGKEVDIP